MRQQNKWGMGLPGVVACFASRISDRFDPDILHQGATMKYHYMKTSWFMGFPFLWNTLHNSDNKTVKIFRFGPILVRVEKDETHS